VAGHGSVRSAGSSVRANVRDDEIVPEPPQLGSLEPWSDSEWRLGNGIRRLMGARVRMTVRTGVGHTQTLMGSTNALLTRHYTQGQEHGPYGGVSFTR
jgi:hypothetical protein